MVRNVSKNGIILATARFTALIASRPAYSRLPFACSRTTSSWDRFPPILITQKGRLKATFCVIGAGNGPRATFLSSHCFYEKHDFLKSRFSPFCDTVVTQLVHNLNCVTIASKLLIVKGCIQKIFVSFNLFCNLIKNA